MALSVKELMVWDWCCDRHGFPMQITNVGDDYAYATFEGNEGDPWEFDDKDNQPSLSHLLQKSLRRMGFMTETPNGTTKDLGHMFVLTLLFHLFTER